MGPAIVVSAIAGIESRIADCTKNTAALTIVEPGRGSSIIMQHAAGIDDQDQDRKLRWPEVSLMRYFRTIPHAVRVLVALFVVAQI